MKICAAQTKPIKGDVFGNIENHKKLTDIALSNGAEIIVFPELSITGYEPEMAKELAFDETDARLDVFQTISDDRNAVICIGAPVRNKTGVSISMFVFQPRRARRIYSKKYLHSSEEEFFVSLESSPAIVGDQPDIAFAICYELKIPEHAENAFRVGAKVYLASVVESYDDIDGAVQRLSAIAEKYSMTVLMANCVGRTGIYDCAGRSAVWNSAGKLVGQLDETSEGIIIFDTETREVTKRTI